METHPIADLFPLMSDAEYQPFKADIAANGQREAIWLHKGMILDGRNRWRACIELGLVPQVREYDGGEAELTAFVISLNLHRRHLSESQRAVIGARLANLEAHRPSDKSANMRTSVVTQPQAAAMLNVSERSIQTAKAIERQAPELMPRIAAGEMNLEDAKREIAKAQREVVYAAKQARPFPTGKYRVLYADPPWSYNNSGFVQSAASHYPTMTTEAICGIPVRALTTSETVLFLWATSPLLPDALRVMDAWGFTYKASMVWDKGKGPGIGWFVRTCHELLLIGTRDDNAHPLTKPDSVVHAPPSGHSAKPSEFYALIESMYPGPYCELFSRNARAGWEMWGNEPETQDS